MKKGYFIVIDGLDGAGTTTQTKIIANYIFNKKKENHVLLTREPSNSPYGLKIREKLKNDKNPKENAEEYFSLFLLDRKHHLDNVIKPNLANGIHVVCDRYEISTYAYQQTQGIDKYNIFKEHRKKKIVYPDITFLLDINPEISMKRLETSGEKREVFEQLEFQKELRENYLDAMNIYPNIILVNGSKPIEIVYNNILKNLDKKLKI